MAAALPGLKGQGYAQALEADLVQRHGTLIGGDELRKLLSYPTIEAYLQAVRRGTTPIPIFPIPHRRGRFAIAKDVATWLAGCREEVSG
jgi:hypothetical protein